MVDVNKKSPMNSLPASAASPADWAVSPNGWLSWVLWGRYL